MKPVNIERLARVELRKARDWYDERQSGLGNELLADVLDALEGIERDNDLGPRYKNTRYRFRRLRRFPYVIYYECLPRRVRVIAIAHDKRREGYWKKRKPE